MAARPVVAWLLVVGSVVAGLVSVGLPVAPPASAGARAAVKPRPVVRYGTVVFVADGDTIDVAIDGVASDPGRSGTRVRFLATQAMELYEYHHDLTLDTGECHAVEAAQRLKVLLTTADGRFRRVRLTAADDSSRNLGREARFVAIRGRDGAWHDVGTVLVREGLVIPSYQKTEYARNRSYRALAQAAAARGAGLWDRNSCGAGPAADLAVRVKWDANGNDSANVNGEYVKITNRGARTVDLGRWWVRDSATRPAATKAAARRGYILPAGLRVGPGRSVYVHVGRAPTHRAAGQLYYGLDAPIFENATGAPAYLGDGAYLFDPLGNLRGWQQYPCVSTRPRACVSR